MRACIELLALMIYGVAHADHDGSRSALTRGYTIGGHLLRGGDGTRSYMRGLIIIPTRNEARGIERVLADLPYDLTTEVIVVDSNSQ